MWYYIPKFSGHQLQQLLASGKQQRNTEYERFSDLRWNKTTNKSVLEPLGPEHWQVLAALSRADRRIC